MMEGISNRLTVILGAMIILCSCGKSSEEEIEAANRKETGEVIQPLPKRVYNSVSIKRNFTERNSQEIFSLHLTGESYRDAKVVFSIIRRNGDTLFIRKVDGASLISSADVEKMMNEMEEVEYINQFMSSFFAETSFSSPPYTINDPQRDDFKGNKELWEEIKDDSTAWCFEFSLSKKGGSEVIAYSHVLDSILVYDSTP